MDALLELLSHHARTSLEDLARELNSTPAAVEQRIQELEADGSIRGYQAILDPQKTQSDLVTSIIEVKIAPERGGGFDRLAQRIAKFDQVESCYLMSGGYDLLVIVEGASLQEISQFIAEKLSTIKGILSTATHFRLKSYKEKGTLLIQDPRANRLPVAP